MYVLPIARTVTQRHVAPAFDRWFDESLTRFFGGSNAGTTSRVPAMDVAETDSHYTVALEVPGATRAQLKVTIEGRRVNVETKPAPAAVEVQPAEGQTATEGVAKADAQPAPRVLYRERSAVSFARSVVLPVEVDQAGSDAKFENGVLTLTLAKKVPTGAKQLTIA